MSNPQQDQDKRNRAYDLRLRGWSYRQIGAEMGVSHVTANEYMAEVTLPLIDEVRKQEVDRMQRYLKALEERVNDGDDKAISLSIKISERLCKMLGADMPQQIQVEKSEITQVDLAIQDLLSRQKASNALRLEAASHLRESQVPSDEPSSDIDSIIGDL